MTEYKQKDGKPPVGREKDAMQRRSASKERVGLLVLGNQLFAPAHLGGRKFVDVFMREDEELCTYFRFHRQKIAFFLAAMRHHAHALRQAGYSVTYEALATTEKRPRPAYDDQLAAWVKAQRLQRLVVFEIEDKFFERRIVDCVQALGIALEILPSPMFLTERKTFASYLATHKKPFMHTFYQSQRRRLGVLLDGGKDPRGGKWSFDADNRHPLPKHVAVPDVSDWRHDATTGEVVQLVDARFSGHPGKAAALWLPTDRAGAKRWLRDFLAERLPLFGPYEDALTQRSEVVFHGVLTPFLNVGLLTPGEVLAQVLACGEAHDIALPSLEGFVRQLVGWREFIRGIYQNFDHLQRERNHFGHVRKLSAAWYGSDTGIPPLDDVLRKVLRRGWAHHIERLMVLGSMMLLCEVCPRQAHRWFMEMFVDSSDWVMGPNVYGMALYSDGGLFATKPYFCGANYYCKMGGYRRGSWCDGVDGLYWRFIDRHRDELGRNMRMGQVVRNLDRIAGERKERIYRAAEALQAQLTVAP